MDIVPGSKFGSWEALAYLGPDKSGKARWLCRCACGVERSLQAHALRHGKTMKCRSCAAFGEDVTGRTFGDLVVLGRLGERTSGSGHHYWLCRCSCGREVKAVRGNLLSGNTTRCIWCRARRRRKRTDCSRVLPGWWLRRTEAGAKRRGLSWDVTEEELLQLFKVQGGLCALSGRPIVISSRPREMTASLDRVDPRKGYLLENLQWVCKDINLMKLDYGQAEFLAICCEVADNHRKCKEGKV